MYSGAGATPIIGPVPISNGLTYSAPFPDGGTHFKYQEQPLDTSCGCETCRCFSAGYIHHLFRSHELLAYRLTTIHNLYFYQNLMHEIRESIRNSEFQLFKNMFNALYAPANEPARMEQRNRLISFKPNGKMYFRS